MSLDDWAFVSGVCAARETLFLSERAIDELSGLSPREVSSRLSRSFFGPVEPLDSIDRVSDVRLAQELDEIAKLSPSPAIADILRAGRAAHEMRKVIAELPDGADSRELARFLARLSLRALGLAERFAARLEPPFPEPVAGARSAASLLVDSAELMVTLELADESGDAVVASWADRRAQAASARVARRALAQGLPSEALYFFFRGRLLTARAREFLSDRTERAAAAIAGEFAEGADGPELLEVAAASKGEPFSPGRVLHYLLAFGEQARLIRRAAYRSLGWLETAGEPGRGIAA